jgi:ACT domain-containing protein
MHVIQTDRDPGGMEQITVSNAAKEFSEAYKHPNTGVYKNQHCKEIFATVETDSIRYTVEGTTPTNLIGHLVEKGQSITIKNVNAIQNFQMIRVTSDASVTVTYFF